MKQSLHIEPSNIDYTRKLYCKLFEDSVLNNHTLNQFKILVAGMRFGKTHLMIEHDIPFILEYGNANLVIASCPIKGPLTQNEYNINSMCGKYGFWYAGENIKSAKRALSENKKVVMTMTNAMAFYDTMYMRISGVNGFRIHRECEFLLEALYWIKNANFYTFSKHVIVLNLNRLKSSSSI